jgi:hypothetical protein
MKEPNEYNLMIHNLHKEGIFEFMKGLISMIEQTTYQLTYKDTEEVGFKLRLIYFQLNDILVEHFPGDQEIMNRDKRLFRYWEFNGFSKKDLKLPIKDRK